MILKYLNDDLESRYADLGNNFSFDVGFAGANVFITFYRIDGDGKVKMIEINVALNLDNLHEDFAVLMLEIIDSSDKLLERAQKEIELSIEEALEEQEIFFNLNSLAFHLCEVLTDICVDSLNDIKNGPVQPVL